MGMFYDKLFSTSVGLQLKMLKAFSRDHLPNPKSKSALIFWDTEVIIVNLLHESMENLLKSIFTQQDIIWFFLLSDNSSSYLCLI